MKTDSKGYILCNFIYMTFWTRQNYRDRKQITGYEGEGLEEDGARGNFLRVMKLFYIFIVVMVT